MKTAASISTPSGLTLEKIAANFQSLDEWEDRFTYLIELGRKMPPMAEADKTETNRVHGCQATVYLKPTAEGEPPRLLFSAWADAATVCGLITILLTMYSGRSPQDIASYDAESYFRRLGLEEHLSPTRRNGLYSMIQKIRTIARAGRPHE
jgi:cysteine desulfuration protein SufE